MFPLIPRLPPLRLTLFGRSITLIAAELLANVALWITAGILFGRDAEKRKVLGLALIAWVSWNGEREGGGGCEWRRTDGV